MSARIMCVVVVAVLIGACGGDSGKEQRAGTIDLGGIDICGNPISVPVGSEREAAGDFGDGSDGELYLAFGEELALEEKTYNFTNVNLDQGSVLTIVGASSEGTGEIRINSLGVCNLLGDINLPDYLGALSLNCYSSIVVQGSINLSNGSLSLATYDSSIASGGASGSGSGSSVSTGSIDLSGAPEVTLNVLCN